MFVEINKSLKRILEIEIFYSATILSNSLLVQLVIYMLNGTQNPSFPMHSKTMTFGNALFMKIV